MERIKFRNSRGQVVTVTVEGTPTRPGELEVCARYLAECLGTEVRDGEHGPGAYMGTATRDFGVHRSMTKPVKR